MKKTIFTGMFLLVSIASFAQAKWNQKYQNYIDTYKDVAIHEMQRYNIPASITLAQGLLESGAGSSELAQKGNNHFGIKCHGWGGRSVYHDDDARGECFRAYDNAYQSYEDHSQFLRNSQRYASLFQLKNTDYKGWAHGLKAAGYATNPQYAYSLINIIETYELYKYDSASKYYTPASQKVVVEHYVVKACNKNYYIRAHRGDTFKTLAKEFGIPAYKLASYNERDVRDVLGQDDIIYLKKKRSKADKVFRGVPHIVKAGESMYTISQKYGVRLRSLYKMNGLLPDYQLQVGDKLRVY